VTVGLGCEYMLVPSHEILRWSETTAQENLLEVLREGIGGDEVRRLAERCGFAGDPSDLAAIARCVAREIVSGRLVPIAMPEPQRGLTPIFSRNERRFDWADAVPLSSLRERESTVDIPWRARIVMDDGAAIARHQVELTPPGAAPRTLDTDARGEVGLKGLADADLVTVTLAPVAVARWRGAADGFVTSQHRAAFPFAVPAVFELPAGELQTVVLGRPLVQRIATDTIRFARDSSMLVPLVASHSHLVALATAIATLTRTADARLLAVGHASADGNAASNAALGLQRAQCVRHLMAGDRDRWVALATEHGTPADIQRLLLYLAHTHGWPSDPGRTDGVMSESVADGVRGFQQQYNDIYDATIDVDGVIGEQTLAALFDAQSYELHEHIAALGGSTDALRWYDDTGIASAGADVLVHPAIVESSAPDGQRRCDLLVTPGDLAWTQSNGVSLLYDVARFATIPMPPVAVGQRDLVLRLLDHYGRSLGREPYILITDVERREGISDETGLVVERALQGELSQIECGGVPRLPVDVPYEAQCEPRHAWVAATDLGDDDDDDDDDGDENDDDENDESDLVPGLLDGDVEDGPIDDALDHDEIDTDADQE